MTTTGVAAAADGPDRLALRLAQRDHRSHRALLGKSSHSFRNTIFDSALLQTSLSLCWSLTALTTMVVATRHGRRPVWLTGGAFLAAVVVKLFAVDLSGVGTVARIVSFIGVCLLMLLIGYLSPVPPPEREEG